MIFLDTDHLSVFTDDRDARHEALSERLDGAADAIACTIISVEEMFRGWLAIINRLRDVRRQVPAYERLRHMFDVLNEWEIAPFDHRAAQQFLELKRDHGRIGTMDLKIASIALANDALLLTANVRDYSPIPGLHCENWLKP